MKVDCEVSQIRPDYDPTSSVYFNCINNSESGIGVWGTDWEKRGAVTYLAIKDITFCLVKFVSEEAFRDWLENGGGKHFGNFVKLKEYGEAVQI